MQGESQVDFSRHFRGSNNLDGSRLWHPVLHLPVSSSFSVPWTPATLLFLSVEALPESLSCPLATESCCRFQTVPPRLITGISLHALGHLSHAHLFPWQRSIWSQILTCKKAPLKTKAVASGQFFNAFDNRSQKKIKLGNQTQPFTWKASRGKFSQGSALKRPITKMKKKTHTRELRFQQKNLY